MCLLKPSKQKIAKKDITCYTIVRRWITQKRPHIVNGNSYLSLYYPAEIKLGATMTSDLLYDSDSVIQTGLHSFNHLKSAKDMFNILLAYPNLHNYQYRGSRLVVLKNIIPKGAKYYSGTFNGCAARASNERKAIEEILI